MPTTAEVNATNSTVWYKSKVLWANVLGIAATVIDGQYGSSGIPPQYIGYAMLGINLVLRFLTNGSIVASK